MCNVHVSPSFYIYTYISLHVCSRMHTLIVAKQKQQGKLTIIYKQSLIQEKLFKVSHTNFFSYSKVIATKLFEHIYVYIYICLCVYTYIYIIYTNTRTHTQIYMYIYTDIYVYTHTHRYIYIYICIYIVKKNSSGGHAYSLLMA